MNTALRKNLEFIQITRSLRGRATLYAKFFTQYAIRCTLSAVFLTNKANSNPIKAKIKLVLTGASCTELVEGSEIEWANQTQRSFCVKIGKMVAFFTLNLSAEKNSLSRTISKYIHIDCIERHIQFDWNQCTSVKKVNTSIKNINFQTVLKKHTVSPADKRN
jgi:hypothetical protein